MINETKTNIEDKFCPDVPDFESKYKVKNAYVNSISRNSFSLAVEKCMKERNPYCKNDSEIDELLKLIYFTTFTVVQKVSFESLATHSVPFISKDVFHS